MATRVVIVFCEAGGGHRSAGEALAEALLACYGSQVSVAMIDVMSDYAPYPLSRLPAWYPSIVKYGRWAWALGFRLTDGPRRARMLNGLVWPAVRRGAERFVHNCHADLVVFVHPPVIAPILRAWRTGRPAFVTVVTDLGSVHALWFHQGVDLTFVPTESARRVALGCGLAADRVRVSGLPVAARFAVAEERASLRRRLGWDTELPVVLVVGGGEGMGPVFGVSRAVAASGLRCQLVVVAGRHHVLREQLERVPWEMPTHVYGFVTRMPDFMRAADVLVTKAGPGTLAESFVVGLPVVLYGCVPGQESGNVGYVTAAGAGVWAPSPERVVAALAKWVGENADPRALARAQASARALGRPDAARLIAEAIWRIAAER